MFCFINKILICALDLISRFNKTLERSRNRTCTATCTCTCSEVLNHVHIVSSENKSMSKSQVGLPVFF